MALRAKVRSIQRIGAAVVSVVSDTVSSGANANKARSTIDSQYRMCVVSR
jgi:hypothetical protein